MKRALTAGLSLWSSLVAGCSDQASLDVDPQGPGSTTAASGVATSGSAGSTSAGRSSGSGGNGRVEELPGRQCHQQHVRGVGPVAAFGG
jgi:hypothetical protein